MNPIIVPLQCKTIYRDLYNFGHLLHMSGHNIKRHSVCFERGVLEQRQDDVEDDFDDRKLI